MLPQHLPQGEASCRPGHVITGIHVAWEPAPVAPFSNLATGVMVHCSDPNTCPGSSADAPAPTYPASSPPPGPPKHDIPSGTWSDGSPAPPTSPPAAPVDGNSSVGVRDWSPWLGRSTPQSTIGICPCPGFIQVRSRRSCRQPIVPDLKLTQPGASLPSSACFGLQLSPCSLLYVALLWLPGLPHRAFQFGMRRACVLHLPTGAPSAA